MRRFETAIDIDVPLSRVWAVPAGIERWHEWTASVNRYIRMEAEGLEHRAEAP